MEYPAGLRRPKPRGRRWGDGPAPCPVPRRFPRGLSHQVTSGRLAAAPRAPRNQEERGLDPHDEGSSVPPAGVCEAAQVPASPGNTVPAHRPGAGEACTLALTFLFWTHPPEVAERAVQTCSSFPPHHPSPRAGTAWGRRGTEEKDIFRGKLCRLSTTDTLRKASRENGSLAGKGKTPISLSGDLG